MSTCIHVEQISHPSRVIMERVSAAASDIYHPPHSTVLENIRTVSGYTTTYHPQLIKAMYSVS